MKKNILYVCMACLALSFTACSDDPNDAVEKHVYTESEAPYLRIDASANITYNAEFREGHIAPISISLKNYAEKIQENKLLPFHALNIFSVKNPVICDSYLQMVLSLKG